MSFLQESRVVWLTFRTNVRAAMELRLAFGLQVFGMVLNDVAFLILWLSFFRVFGTVNGWQGQDMIGLLGSSMFIFGVCMAFAEGTADLPRLVRTGAFDAFLLTPRNVLCRVATRQSSISALGDVGFGALLIGVYIFLAHVSFAHVLLLLAVLPASVITFLSVYICTQTVGFYMDDAENVAFSLFRTFLSPTLYPGTLFVGVYKFLFTLVIPSLAVGGLPAEVLKSADWQTVLLLWAIAAIWGCMSVTFFNFSLRKYESGNQMGG